MVHVDTFSRQEPTMKCPTAAIPIKLQVKAMKIRGAFNAPAASDKANEGSVFDLSSGPASNDIFAVSLDQPSQQFLEQDSFVMRTPDTLKAQPAPAAEPKPPDTPKDPHSEAMMMNFFTRSTDLTATDLGFLGIESPVLKATDYSASSAAVDVSAPLSPPVRGGKSEHHWQFQCSPLKLPTINGVTVSPIPPTVTVTPAPAHLCHSDMSTAYSIDYLNSVPIQTVKPLQALPHQHQHCIEQLHPDHHSTGSVNSLTPTSTASPTKRSRSPASASPEMRTPSPIASWRCAEAAGEGVRISGLSVSASYKRSKAHKGRGVEQDYICGYCRRKKTSASACSDGRVRIRCECGGQHQDNKPRMHATWSPVTPCAPKSAKKEVISLPRTARARKQEYRSSIISTTAPSDAALRWVFIDDTSRVRQGLGTVS